MPAQCQRCPVLSFCHGGCPKDRFTLSEDSEPGLNYLCEGFRRFYTHARANLERMGELVRVGTRPSSIMGELADDEARRERRFQLAGRNDPCPCGSGRKYKHCCLTTRQTRP